MQGDEKMRDFIVARNKQLYLSRLDVQFLGKMESWSGRNFIANRFDEHLTERRLTREK